MTSTISLRPIDDRDKPLLRRIYASTREDELRMTNWEDTQKEAFLSQQFHAQHTYYMQNFPDAEYRVILDGDAPVGRLYVDRRDDEIRIIDIAILPEHRGRGIGSGLMLEILSEASEALKPVRIHVESSNPAMALYERLGFQKTGDTGVYFLMERSPPVRCDS